MLSLSGIRLQEHFVSTTEEMCKSSVMQLNIFLNVNIYKMRIVVLLPSLNWEYFWGERVNVVGGDRVVAVPTLMSEMSKCIPRKLYRL